MAHISAAPRRTGSLLLLAGLAGGAGCASDEAELPSAWDREEEPPTEEASADEIAEATQLLLDGVRDVNAAPVLASYYEAMSYSLAWCPSQTETSAETTGDMRYWDGMCQGDESVWFKGPMTTWTWDGVDLANGTVDIVSDIMGSSGGYDGYSFVGNGIRGQTDIFNPDSSVDFNCSCTAMQGMGMAEDGRVGFFSFMDGPAHWTGDAADDTWMGEGVRPGMWSWAEVSPDEGVQHITMAGNVTGFAERLDTARLDLTLWRPLDGSKACTAGDISSFSLSIRDADTATWYNLEFVLDDSDPTLCEACATLPSGEELCVDLSPTISWSNAPW